MNNIKLTTLAFGGKELKIKANQPQYLVIKTDALRLLNGPANISFAKNPSVMAGPYSATIADNYLHMFSFGGIVKSLNTASEPTMARND
ncbi:MAG: hypothetical protein IPN74_20290 [Haliscomenobacter sp.]|nr:hypothetical protein [Haliscomenobacter sp.]